MIELDGDERAELERLRAAAAARGGRGRRAARWTAAGLLIVLAALTAIAGVVGVYAKAELLDTERYVATVAPLARDDDVTEAVADRLTDELMSALDIAGVSQQLVDALVEQGAPEALDGFAGPIADGVRSFVHDQVTRVVESERFATVWDNANRTAHEELAAVLTGDDGGRLSVDDDTVYIDLGAVFAQVKQRLVDRGFTLVERVPDVSVTVPLLASERIGTIQRATSLLQAAAWVLPVAVVLLLAAAAVVAPNRRRALLIGVGAFAAAMLLLLGLIRVARVFYAENLPETVRSPDAALAVYDAVARFLISGLQTLLVLGLIVLVVCWLLGPGRLARAIRRIASRGLDRTAALTARTGFGLGRFADAVAAHRVAIEVGLVIVAAGVLVLWRHPGIAGTLWTALVLAVLVAAVELVGRIATRPAS